MILILYSIVSTRPHLYSFVIAAFPFRSVSLGTKGKPLYQGMFTLPWPFPFPLPQAKNTGKEKVQAKNTGKGKKGKETGNGEMGKRQETGQGKKGKGKRNREQAKETRAEAKGKREQGTRETGRPRQRTRAKGKTGDDPGHFQRPWPFPFPFWCAGLSLFPSPASPEPAIQFQLALWI